MPVGNPPRSHLVTVPAGGRTDPERAGAENVAGGRAAGGSNDAAPGARPGLPMRFPIRHAVRRRKRWWRRFMSPVWLALAAPALVLPLLVMILMEDPAMPSMVEQAISSLPIPGDASDSDQPGRTGRVEVMGASGAAMPSTVAASLYNNSARAAAARLAQRSEPRDAVPDINTLSYALLHPRSLRGEDLLIGDLTLMTSTPGPDLGWAIFNAYCQSAPTEGVSLQELPIDQKVVSAIVNFVPVSEYARLCPRLG